MPMQYCDCKTPLPFSVLRWVRAFGPRMQAGLVKSLKKRQEEKGTLSAQDVGECISIAWDMLEADVESRLEFPPPDALRVKLARQQAQEGRGCTIDEILNELP